MSQIDDRISSMSVFERHLTVWVALLLSLLALATGDPEDTYVSRNEFANSTMIT